MSEFGVKQQRVRALLAERNLDALLLSRVSSFAWATCGAASYVNTATTFGASSLLILPDARYVTTNNIEAPRLVKEEQLAQQGWVLRVTPWHAAQTAAADLVRGLRIGADSPYPGAVDLTNDLARLRARLTPEEGVRMRELGRLCAEAMGRGARAVRPGQTEYSIAARLADETMQMGVQPIVNLIATDERVFEFRHPLPTSKKLAQYAMLVLVGRQRGLTCSLTRLVHFGPMPDELKRKAQAVGRVDAALISSTRPGQTLGAIFQRAQNAYGEAGFGDEWQWHHQGGATGYEPREYLGMPGSTDVVAEGQAFTWNPSIRGTKSEDTILIGEGGNEILTAIADWPTAHISADGKAISRPVVLEILD